MIDNNKPKLLKVLYITRKYPPSIGGMQTQSAQFYKSLSNCSEVTLIFWGHSQVFLPLFAGFAFIRALVELFRKDIDVVQMGDLVLSPLGLALKYIFKKPTLSVSHGRDSVYHSFLYDSFVIAAAKRLDKIICVSNGIKDRLIARGFTAKRLSVIPNGITVNSNHIAAKRGESASLIENKFGIDLKNKKVILSISRLVPKKGIKEFIENIFPIINKKDPDSILLVAGDGPEKADILKAVKKLEYNDKIFLLGNVERDSELYDSLFSVSSVFIMPNVRVSGDFEGFGMVVLEASINGIPVVAYDIDGISEALHDGQNGVLIKEGNINGFADAALLFINDSNFRQNFSVRSQEYVKSRFGWSSIIARYANEYENLLASE